MRARVPAAGRSCETAFAVPFPLRQPFRDRPLAFRAVVLVLRTRLAAVGVTVKWPFPFMVWFLAASKPGIAWSGRVLHLGKCYFYVIHV